MSKIFTTLISVVELTQHVDKKNWIILDCRHDLVDTDAGRRAFAEGHIPGAQFVQLDHDLSGNQISAEGVFCGRHPLPDQDEFINRLRGLGINDDTQVVVYDAHGSMFAARCWWMLRWVGHAAAAVLDGGLPAWMAAHQPLSTDTPVLLPGSIQKKASLVQSVNVDEVLANLSLQQKTLVDARSPERYRGENETLDKVGGHIPGAKNRFFKDNLQANNCFKSAPQLRKEWSAVIEDSQNAIMQCGSGVTACHNLLALEIAGMPGAALYAGSWSEWCANPARAVAVEK